MSMCELDCLRETMLLLSAYLSRTLRIGYGFQIIAKVKEVTSSSSLQLSTPAQCDLDTLSLDLVLILTLSFTAANL